MTKEKLIKRICYVPKFFWTEVSPKDRVEWLKIQKENKVYNKKIKISQEDIVKYLEEKNDLIKSWLCYSEDRRGGSSFYFEKKNNNYISGYLGGLFNKSKIIITAKKPEISCANFIINELKLK